MALGVIFLLLFLITSFGGEYIVKSEDPTKVVGKVKKRIGRDLYLVEIDDRLLNGLELSGKVLIEKNYPLRTLQTPNDPCTDRKQELDMVRAKEAWDLSTGSDTVYVAVLDTGVDYNHPDLKDNLWRNPDEICDNNTDDDRNGYVDDCYGIDAVNGDSDPMDDNGHGTAVASVLGAVGNNARLIPGINWKVKIIPCKLLDSSGAGSVAGELECLEYILSLKRNKRLNIVAVNASYGAEYPDSQFQREKIEELAQEGILYITAAGNEGKNNDVVNLNPCNYDLENMICVGSVDLNGERSYFSNFSFNKVKISAPGEGILALKAGNTSESCDSLLKLSGTSLSTPFVTGAVALLKSYEPSLSYGEVRRRILLTGRKYTSLAGQNYTCSVLDFHALLRNESFPKACPSTLVLSWGDVSDCSPRTREFMVRNTGATPVQVVRVSLEGRGFSLQEDNCSGRTLSSFEECSVLITFYPSDKGTYSGRLYVSFSDSSLDFSAELSASSFAICGSGGCQSSTSNLFTFLLALSLLILRRLPR